MYQNFLKTGSDFIVALIAIIIFAPVLLVVTLLLAIANGGNPFFLQNRPGKNERIFKLIKFRTMKDAFDASGNPLPDKERITPIGQFIRKVSLDELPQLFNVLKGDMSLIGPRPLLVKYLPLYNDFQKQRHLVKPGITGWAQVNGRNAISWDKKFELDVWYVHNLSFALDIKILFLTVYKVVKKEGIDNSIQHTMSPFTGNKA